MRNPWLLLLIGLATGLISEKLLVSSQSSLPIVDDLYLEGRPSGDFPVDDEDDQDGNSGSGSGDYVFSHSDEVPIHPNKSTADSHRSPPTTAAEIQDQTTRVRTTPYVFFDGDNKEQEVSHIGPTADWFTKATSPSSTYKPSRETTGVKLNMDVSVTKESDEDNSLDKSNVLTPNDSEEELLPKMFENEIFNKGTKGRIYEQEPLEEVPPGNMWERTEVLAAVIACGVVGFLCAVFLLLLLAYRMKKKDEGSYDLGDTKLSTTAYQKAPTKEFYA
ncbi:Syndecan-2-B [Channa argus]|uniref:Syndecan n=1 Tax=Channa argus TaxID=215402 RepID=A0A6G1PN65_CHAAH|nr:Syndecan-2-B [Channa argus]